MLTIFIDALGRAAFRRYLPKTVKWFEERDRLKGTKGIEYFRYYSVRPYTWPNIMTYYYEAAASFPTNLYQCHNNHYLETFNC